MRIFFLDGTENTDDTGRMTVSRINNECIYSGSNESVNAFHRISRYTDTGGDTQTTQGVFRCIWFVFCFRYIFICDQANEMTGRVNYRKFLDFVTLENLGRLFEIGRLTRGDEVVACHYFADGEIHIAFEAKVTVGNDSDQKSLIVNHGNTADVILFHHCKSISDRFIPANGHGVVDHAVFSAFHRMDLTCLFGDRHVFVDDPDTSLAGDCDC